MTKATTPVHALTSVRNVVCPITQFFSLTWGMTPMCVVCQEGKNLPFFDHQSGLKTKNRASCPGSRLRSEAEHPQGLTLRDGGDRSRWRKKRAVGSSSIPGSLRLGRGAETPAHARSAE